MFTQILISLISIKVLSQSRRILGLLMRIEHPRRIPFFVLAIASLLVGMAAGLVRLGHDVPLPNRNVLVAHGPIMVSGFLGTLIALERAVALGQRWGFLAPLFTLLGSGWMIFRPESRVGSVFMVAGSLGVGLILAKIWWTHKVPHTLLLLAGSLCWTVGNLLLAWFHRVTPCILWWFAFLLLTIVAERLELNRLLRIKRIHRWMLGLTIALFLIGVALSSYGFSFGKGGTLSIDGIGDVSKSPFVNIGYRSVGLGLIGVGLWLLRLDLARKNLSRPGMPRFISMSLLCGFSWLVICGAICVGSGGVLSGPRSDALLHSFFLGFTLCMVLGHAPIIFPAVLGVSATFGRFFYLPLILLNASLIVRISGDFVNSFSARKSGAGLNAIAILTLFLVNLWSMRAKERAAGSKTGTSIQP